jgi:hypothetical protein
MAKNVWMVGAAVLGLASFALAGLPEREKQRELEPKVKAASDAVAATCGCSPAVAVDWATFKTVESMYTVDFAVASYQEIAEATCKADQQAKAGFCSNVKNVAVKWTAEEPNAVCAAGTCTFTVGSQSYQTAPFKDFLEKL